MWRRPVPTRAASESIGSAAIYRVAFAAVGVAVGALAVLDLLGNGPARSVAAGAVLGLSVLGWLPLGRVWLGRGVAAWALAVDIGVAGLAFIVWWTLTTDLGPLAVAGAVVLWPLAAMAYAIGLAYIWDFVDTRTRTVPAATRGPLGPFRSFLGTATGSPRRLGGIAFAVAATVTVIGLVTVVLSPGTSEHAASGQGSAPDLRPTDSAPSTDRPEPSGTPVPTDRPSSTSSSPPPSETTGRSTPEAGEPTSVPDEPSDESADDEPPDDGPTQRPAPNDKPPGKPDHPPGKPESPGNPDDRPKDKD